MKTGIDIESSVLSPPGDTLQEHIDYIGMSQAELAQRMGRAKEKINDIIKGRVPITTSTAFRLEKVLGIPANFWINRENSYRSDLYGLLLREEHRGEIDWLNLFPIKEMQKFGWIPKSPEKHLMVEHLLKFFGVASSEEWKTIYLEKGLPVAFRVSLSLSQNPYAVSAWLRRGEIQSKDSLLAPFQKAMFKDALTEIKELAIGLPNDYFIRAQEICARSGVSLVFTPSLPKAPISGAARWFRNRPLIQLSGRFKTEDHFWFSFFHEAGHILLHGKKDVFLENVEDSQTDQKKESEADAFASKFLISETEILEVLKSFPISKEVIEFFAKKFHVPAGIIVGRLQHLKHIPFHLHNNLKRKIDLSYLDQNI